jgi:hypothetical protein
MLAMTLPLTSSSFNSVMQQTFKEQIALAAGMTMVDSSKVFIENVVSTAQLRLLSTGISFDVKIVVASTSTALKVVSLLTQENINSFLTARAIPSVHVTSAAAASYPPAAVLIEMTPAPTQTIGGLSMSNIIAIASSVGGAVGLTIFACCLRRLNKCGYLPNTVKRCLPQRLYIDAEELEASSEQRISERITERLNPLLAMRDASNPKKSAYEGRPTAPLIEPQEALPVPAYYLAERPPAFTPNSHAVHSHVPLGVTSSLVHSNMDQELARAARRNPY